MYQGLSSRLTRDIVGVAVVGDAVVDVAAGRARAALIDQLLRQNRIRVAHVDLLVDHHAELAYLLYVAVLARVQGQALPPDGRVALGEPHDVARHEKLAGLVPDGDVHAGGAVGHFECSNFAVLFSDSRVANLQNDKHYVDVLLARPDILYQHVIHRPFRDSRLRTHDTCTHTHTLARNAAIKRPYRGRSSRVSVTRDACYPNDTRRTSVCQSVRSPPHSEYLPPSAPLDASR